VSVDELVTSPPEILFSKAVEVLVTVVVEAGVLDNAACSWFPLGAGVGLLHDKKTATNTPICVAFFDTI
jgi:hypothetical protein